MKIGDICDRRIPLAAGTMAVVAAAKSMHALGQHILIVTDEQQGKRVATGIVTDCEIAAVIAGERDPGVLLLKDIMRGPPLFIADSDGALDTLSSMRRNDLREAVVHNDDGVLLGMISTDRLVECLAAEIEGAGPAESHCILH